MKSLEIFNARCIKLLHENKLLVPLIKAELKKSIIENIEIDDTQVKSKLETFYEKWKLNKDEDNHFIFKVCECSL